jgi:tetratricopeptide (TPR) repeat protein
VPKQPSRGVAKKDDLDLTPPEEIRARRIKLIVLLGAVAACVLGVAIYFAASPIGRAIKGWQSRRLAREAFSLIDQKKWSDANAKVRDAFLLRPTEPQSWRAFARLASRTNQWPAALDWWKKVDEVHRLTVEDRRDYVGAALVTGDLPLAAKQVEVLLGERAGPAPIDIVFAGQVAARQSDPVLALDYGERALADKRAKPFEILAAATLVLSVTSPSSQVYASAWHEIENVARHPKNPGSLDALTVLAREEALPPMPAIGANTSLSLESPGRSSLGEDGTPLPSATAAAPPSVAGGVDAGLTNAASTKATSLPAVAAAKEGPPPGISFDSAHPPTPPAQSGDTVILNLAATPPSTPAGRRMTLTEVADALENHPDARPYHKLLALEVRARQDPILTDQYVADTVQQFGNAARLAQSYQGGADLADETLLALAAWLNKIGRPAKTLEVLPEARAIQRQDFFLQYVNALAAVQRWSDIKDLLMSEHSVVDPMLQHMYLAVAQAHLGSATGATNEWQRALQVADTPEKLFTLANNAEQNSATDIADAAYSEAIKIAPQNRAAYTGRLRLALTAGHTAQAQEIAAEIARLWPDDPEARNQDTYLQLLLGASRDAAEAAEREAKVLVAKEPRNWQARATLGLACLRLGQKQEALAAIREPRVTGVEPPGALAVRAAILATNGYEDGARNDARLLSAKPLLPEERVLIAPLLQ